MSVKVTAKGILYESPEGERSVFCDSRDAMFKLDFKYTSGQIRGFAMLKRNGFRFVTRVYRVETKKGQVVEGVFNDACTSLTPLEEGGKKVYMCNIVAIEDITLAQDL